MNKLRQIFLVILLGLSTVANANKGVIRILAIGNSFSEDAIENNLYDLAAADGRKTVVANMYIGGCSLKRHLDNARDNNDAYRYRKVGLDGIRRQTDRMTLERAIKDEKWDYISLQQASGLSGFYDTYTPFLPALVSYVRNNAPKGCKLLWHQTWSYSKDSSHEAFKNYNKDQMKMYHAIMDCSRRAVEDNKLSMVIPSGTAVQNARTSFIGDSDSLSSV